MLEIVPFTDDHLDGAAELLAARQAALRETEPLLPARFTEPGAARAAIAAVWGAEDATGVAAVREGSLVGYLIGAPIIDTLWGRTAWVRFAGHARALDLPAEIYQDLYAALAPAWVARGCFDHYILVPAADLEAQMAWFSLGFGRETAHALREVEPVESEPVPELTIRRATEDDLEMILTVADLIAAHQAGSPVFGAWLPESRGWWREGWAEMLATPGATVWLAFRGEQLAGAQLWVPVTGVDDPMVPEGAIELKFAATRPEERGRGVNRALMAAGLAGAREHGAHAVVTDWRTANLLSSRHWPRRGFRTIAYRLHRTIDSRIAWARA